MTEVESTYMQLIDTIFTFVAPTAVLIILASYGLMFLYIYSNKVKLEHIGIWSWIFTVHYYFEIPTKYSDAYRSKHGKMGPWLKMLFLGLALFGATWFSVVALIILKMVS